MEPGIELDKLIAEKVMGLEVVKTIYNKKQRFYYTIGEPDYYDDGGEMKLFNYLPGYSEDIAAAWEVIHKLPFVVELTTNNPYGPTTPETEWLVTFNAEFEAHGSTAPHAICLAALRAVGYEL
jgi:hypothetical protein